MKSAALLVTKLWPLEHEDAALRGVTPKGH